MMRPLIRGAAALVLLAALAGCASTRVTPREAYAGPALPRPDRILVYDFGATPGDVPADSRLGAEAAGPAPQTPADAELGWRLGAEVARQLVLDLRAMGLPAVRVAGEAPPAPGDILIRGNFYAIDQGSSGRRVLLGFGSGAAELRAAVDAYRMTPEGPRHLAGGDTDSGGGKTPGMAAPVAVFAATANPLGLIVVGAAKVYGERSGGSTVEGAAKRTADAIAERVKVGARRQGWI